MRGLGYAVGALVFVALLVAVIVVMSKQMHDCSEAGGVLVRGVFWFECIRGTK